MKLINSSLVYLISVLFFISCSRDDTRAQQELANQFSVVATNNHIDDGSVDNGDGTTTNTLGGVSFVTIHNDYSDQPSLMSNQRVTARLNETYTFPNEVVNFKVVDQHLYVNEAVSSFENYFATYLLSDQSQISKISANDSYISGFDFNGVGVVVDGGEDLDFYTVEDGEIKERFFSYENFVGSRFVSSLFVDENKCYVYEADKIWAFTFGDIDNVQVVTTVPEFNTIAFDTDENNLYISAGDHGSSSIKIIDKDHHSLIHNIDLQGQYITGLAVDANYIYVSNATFTSQRVYVYDKYTYEELGSFSVNAPRSLQKVGNQLYVANFNLKTIERYSIAFE